MIGWQVLFGEIDTGYLIAQCPAIVTLISAETNPWTPPCDLREAARA